MYTNMNNIKNIELPDNLFSNLGETNYTVKETKINNDNLEPSIHNDIKIEESNDSLNPKTEKPQDLLEPKLINLSNKIEYRDRMVKIYNEMNDIEPIDNEINNTIYTKDYSERGIVIKPKLSSLKQLWTEFRLISNEKNKKVQKEEKNTNLDELFSQLSNRVKEINEYIDELKEMRLSIEETNNRLTNEKELLEEEKRNFMSYKEQQEEKIKEERDNLKIEKENIQKNYNRLQNIIDDLNNKINSIE